MRIPKKFQGMHSHRYKDHPDEQRFASQWAKLCRDGHLEDQLSQTTWPWPVTKEARIVSNTVIQWLGSPVGQIFLRECGFVKKNEQRRT